MRKENFLKEKTSLSCFLFNFPFPLLVVVAKVQNIPFTSRTSEVFCTLSTKRLMSLGSCLFLFFLPLSSKTRCDWLLYPSVWLSYLPVKNSVQFMTRLRKTIFMLLSRQSIIWLSLKDWDLSLGVSHYRIVIMKLRAVSNIILFVQCFVCTRRFENSACFSAAAVTHFTSDSHS